MSIFSKKLSPKEQLRKNDREIKKNVRDVDRDRSDLEKLEKKLELEIKQAAKSGNKEVLTVLAKQLVNLRKQKTKTYTVGSRIQAIGTQGKLMHSNMKMADVMSSTSKTLSTMNKVFDPLKTSEIMKEFEKQSLKMNMTEDLINDTLDDIMNESGDEEEQDAIVDQVLDEIGIEISEKLIAAPKVTRGSLVDKQKQKELSDDELEKQLANLKAL